MLRRFQFLQLEHPYMMSKGRTVRTTASPTVRMNTGRVVGDSRPIKNKKESHFKIENMSVLIFIVVK